MLYPEVIKEKPEPLDKEDFLKQIQAELQLSRNFVNVKRDYLRNNISKYIDQTTDDEKFNVNIVYAMLKLDIAIEMLDSKEPIFSPRGIGDDEIAENLTDVAKFDYNEMKLDLIQYAGALDRRMF